MLSCPVCQAECLDTPGFVQHVNAAHSERESTLHGFIKDCLLRDVLGNVFKRVRLEEREEPSSFSCGDCNKMFPTEKGRHIHVGMVHKKQRRRREEDHRCPECEQAFEFASMLRRHMLDHSRRKKSPVKPLKEPLKRPLKQPLREPLKEPLEKPLMKSLKKPLKEPLREPLMKPLKKPLKEEKLKPFCYTCEVSFASEDKLEAHLKQHVSGLGTQAGFKRPRKASNPAAQYEYRCKGCSQAYPSEAAVLEHKQSCPESVEYKLKCPKCWQDFSWSHELDQHARVCGKPASSSTCGQCSAVFDSDFERKQHVLHSHLSNYKRRRLLHCDQQGCKQTFRDGPEMMRHKQASHGQTFYLD